MSTARAVVLPAFHSNLEVRELPCSEPGPGAMVATLELAGGCATDVHLLAPGIRGCARRDLGRALRGPRRPSEVRGV